MSCISKEEVEKKRKRVREILKQNKEEKIEKKKNKVIKYG